jgi:hypothetical protein
MIAAFAALERSEWSSALQLRLACFGMDDFVALRLLISLSLSGPSSFCEANVSSSLDRSTCFPMTQTVVDSNVACYSFSSQSAVIGAWHELHCVALGVSLKCTCDTSTCTWPEMTHGELLAPSTWWKNRRFIYVKNIAPFEMKSTANSLR